MPFFGCKVGRIVSAWPSKEKFKVRTRFKTTLRQRAVYKVLTFLELLPKGADPGSVLSNLALYAWPSETVADGGHWSVTIWEFFKENVAEAMHRP